MTNSGVFPSSQICLKKYKHHLHIRTMAQNDLESLFPLWTKAKLTINDEVREKNECQKLIDLNPTSCFVAEDNGKIIGSIFGSFNGRRAWLYHLAVHPHYQKLGIGSLLVNKAKENLIERGATKILVGVSFTNLKVVPFYEKLGFKAMHEAVHFELDLQGFIQ